jgi:6-phosphogluconolactonase (cycloisomerase 2 family)
VTAWDEDSLAVFSRNETTGILTFVEAIRDGVECDCLTEAYGVTISPDASHLYVVSEDDDTLALFSRSTTTGRLTLVTEFRFTFNTSRLNKPNDVVVSPDGKHIYVANIGNVLTTFSRNSTTGVPTFVDAIYSSDLGANSDALNRATELFISPDGKYIYVAGSFGNAIGVFSRNSTTGVLTFVEMQQDGVGEVEGILNTYSIGISPDGDHVYGGGYSGDSLAVFRRNSTTGSLTFVEAIFSTDPGIDGLDGPANLTVSPDGKHLYVSDYNGDAVTVFAGAAGSANPAITSHQPGETLAGSPTELVWSANGNAVLSWALYVGTTPGATDVFNSGILPGSTTSLDVPVGVGDTWITLYSYDSNGWNSVENLYVGAGVLSPEITTPSPMSALSGAAVTFTWNPHGVTPSNWLLRVGTTPDGGDLYSSPLLNSFTNSQLVNGLPTDGSDLYVSLWWYDGNWKTSDWTYQAANGQGNAPTGIGEPGDPFAVPVPGSTAWSLMAMALVFAGLALWRVRATRLRQRG